MNTDELGNGAEPLDAGAEALLALMTTPGEQEVGFTTRHDAERNLMVVTQTVNGKAAGSIAFPLAFLKTFLTLLIHEAWRSGAMTPPSANDSAAAVPAQTQ